MNTHANSTYFWIVIAAVLFTCSFWFTTVFAQDFSDMGAAQGVTDTTVTQGLQAPGNTNVVPQQPAPSNQGTAITYQPLVGIPGLSNNASNFNQYINQLYFLSISIAALLAVIKIIIGGVKWMLTDIVTSKSEAKKEIWGALLGLLLIISAVLILGTINPQLNQLNVLSSAPPVSLTRENPAAPPPSQYNQPIGTETRVVTNSVATDPVQRFTPQAGRTTLEQQDQENIARACLQPQGTRGAGTVTIEYQATPGGAATAAPYTRALPRGVVAMTCTRP